MKAYLLVSSFLCILFACTDRDAIDPSYGTPETIPNLMRRVCDWQLRNPSARIDHEYKMWERAVFYTGVMATYRTTQDPTGSWRQPGSGVKSMTMRRDLGNCTAMIT